MRISGRHIAVLVYDYFEQSEFEEPISILKDAGAEVTVIAADTKKLHAVRHGQLADAFTADLLLDQANPEDYDALVLPGGALNADKLRVVERAQQWAVDFLDVDKPVAAICHAPWLLVSAGVVDGRQLTSYHTIRDDITNAGGDWVDLPVVVDDNLITSRKPDDIPQFADALIDLLSKKPPSAIQTGSDTLVANTEQRTEKDTWLRAMGYDKGEDQITSSDEDDLLADEDSSDPDELYSDDLDPYENDETS